MKVKTVSEDKKTESNPLGDLNLDEQQNQVISFEEKVQADSGWINGGYFVLNKEILKTQKVKN